MNAPSKQSDYEKAIRLFKYLSALASLRNKIVRDIEDYEKVLWLGDIPESPNCISRLLNPNDEYDTDVWLEIRHLREPPVPSVPRECRDWVDAESLYIKDRIPALLPEIPIVHPESAVPNDEMYSDEASALDEAVDRLENHPELKEEWDRYVNQEWIPWRDRHKEWERVTKVYTDLFDIHQAQLRLGEEYELVIGLGLLTWQTSNGQRIRRHLIVANAQ